MARPEDSDAATGLDVTDVAVVIPAYQASASVAEVVHGAAEWIDPVVVVDDGSTDGTGDAAASAGAQVIRHQHNRGKGAALSTGLTKVFAADGIAATWALTLDADGQHLPSEIPKLLDARRPDVHLVMGTRAHLFAAMSPVRRTSNRWSSRLISFLAGLSVPDVQTGFRLYHRDLFAAVGGMPEDRFDAESAIVVRAGRRGFAVATVPIELGTADGRSTSHYRGLVDGLRIARGVARARLESVR
ncbi:MAG: glycosyltransferase family 2 protein [Acidobacteriota bacterium]